MKSAAVSLGLLLALLPGLAHAQSDDTSELEGLLDTTVVSAPSKSNEAVSTAPAASKVLTAEDLRRYGIRSLDEAINFLAMGMATEKFFQSAEIGSRGVLLSSDFGSHVLLLLDGHVMNENWSATEYMDRGATVPFELIDHIEIVLGPGSVLYGSSAMLGIINIVTKRARDFSGAHLVLESELPVSIRGAVGYGKQFELFGREAEVVMELEHYEQHGPTYNLGPIQKDPDSVTGQYRTYDQHPGGRVYAPGVWGGAGDDAYYTKAPAGYVRLKAGDFTIALRGALYKRSTPVDSGNFDDPHSYEQDRWLSLDAKHQTSLSEALQLSTRLYTDIYDYNEYWGSTGAEDCLEGQDQGCMWRLYGMHRTVGLEPQLTWDWFKDGRSVTLIGVDGRVKKIKSFVTFTDNVTGQDTGKISAYSPFEKALAVYLQQTVWPVSWVGLNAGARLDVDDRFGSAVSPRAALAFLPWSGGTIKGIYSEAFRAPTAFDIYYHDPSTQLPGGKSLRPEKVQNLEAMIEQHVGTQTFHVGVFRSKWKDLLLLQQISDDELAQAKQSGGLESTADYGYQVRNVSRVHSWGFDFGFDGSSLKDTLHYGLNLTEAVARRVEPGDDGQDTTDFLALAAQSFGNARIAYDLPGGLPTVALATRWVGHRPTDVYADETDPRNRWANRSLEGRLTLSGDFPGVSGLSYRLTANYNTAKRAPYVTKGGTLPDGLREFAPVDRLRFGAGLQYDFWK